MSTVLVCEEPRSEGRTTGGRYRIERFNGVGFELTSQDFLQDAQGSLLFPEDGESIPLEISVACEEKSIEPLGMIVNDVISLCTLTVWPFMDIQERAYVVSVKSPHAEDSENFNIQYRTWISLFNPLAIFPPAISPNSYEWPDVPEGEKREAFWNGQAKKQTIRAVAAILNRGRFAEHVEEIRYLQEQRDSLRANVVKRQVVKKDMERQKRHDELLRSFALKEVPSVWQTVQRLRAESSVLESNTKKLRADLLEFERDPDSDADYQNLCERQRELKGLHDSVYAHLEDAYIAAKKYEAASSGTGLVEMRKRAFEDAENDAKMAIKRFDEMRRKKQEGVICD